ncbi:MAG TPA: PA14 domain-containing protein, partial [Pirellulales bacterium]
AQSRAAASLPATVPLGNLAAKYTVPGLAGFLLDPHKVRPSGRMPSFNLNQDESRQLASYLLEGVQVDAGDVNLNYAYYEGQWNKLPDFATIQPQAAGRVAGFDCAIAPRSQDMALRFSAFIRIDAAGDYTFFTRSDDGSKLWIDGKLAVDNDGIHAPSEKAGDPIKLTAGMHELVAGVFNAGGGVELDVEFSGAGRARQTVLPLLSLTREPPPKLKVADNSDAAFLFDGDLAAKGRDAFIALGCASCHEMSKAKPPADELIVPPALAALKTDRGCLAANRQKGVPRFALSAGQRTALAAAIKSQGKLAAEAAAPKQVIQQTMLALNCYACHTRGGLGGVEEARDPYFETSQKEMGDEGRLPPPLDGVGAKLTTAWLKHIFADGAKDRPYMHTRMPRFGAANAGGLVAAFEAVDPLQPVKAVTFTAAERQIKAAGRQIVGDKGGLGCVKCHNFRDVPSTGIQAMNLTLMPQRLRHDWFRRYVLNPQEFRPGTRMPSAWPNGQTFLPKLLDGTADSQIEAVWQYLADGDKAMVPYGLARGPIELTPEKEAIIYRNFIEGAGSRAIGVGYPEKANIAFDANDLRLALLWQGAFIDASRHWVDRGAGYQPPLGDNILALAKGPG